MRLIFPLVVLLFLPVEPATTGTAIQARMPMCAIDMGSNTFRRIVASFEKGRYTQHNFEKQTLGVGDDVTKHGRISDAKLAEIEKVLSQFKISCEKDGAGSPVAVGTSAFRDATNGKRAVEIAAKLGIAMEIATEIRESVLAYLVGSLGRDDYAVIDAGSRSIELVSRTRRELFHHVFNLGYRVAYDTFFDKAEDPNQASLAFRNRLRQETSKAWFMRGRTKLVGIEFGEMAEVLFEPAPIEGRVFSLRALRQRLQQITSMRRDEFQALKQKKDIDRALPRLVVAVTLAEAFGYSQLELTERELGSGLIIEAGLKKK